MTDLVVPAYQTKSKRNLFGGDLGVPEGIRTAVDTPDASSSTDDEIIVDEIKQSSTIEVKCKQLKVVSKSSPCNSKASKGSPKKLKSPQSGGCGFFTTVFGMLVGSGKPRRPVPPAKGVYFDFKTCDYPKESDRTLLVGADYGEPEFVPDWIASNLEGHTRDVPVVVRRPEYDSYNEADDKKLLKKIMVKAKKLPQDPGKYASNHIMVNAVRAQRNIPPVRRERYMDQIARDQAKMMAEERNLFHVESPRDLQLRLKELDAESNVLPDITRLGMNIGRGKSISEVHRFMMAALAERNNIQDKRFSSMGMGTHKDKNGVLYMCQVYGG